MFVESATPLNSDWVPRNENIIEDDVYNRESLSVSKHYLCYVCALKNQLKAVNCIIKVVLYTDIKRKKCCSKIDLADLSFELIISLRRCRLCYVKITVFCCSTDKSTIIWLKIWERLPLSIYIGWCSFDFAANQFV